MKAIVQKKYGSADVLELREIDMPKPADNEVLVKVRASSANAGDWRLLRGDPFVVRFMNGPRRPKNPILGADIAGRVEAVGRQVTRFQPGDEVFGDLSDRGFGGFAEYVSASEEAFATRPASLTFEEAAAVPSAAVTALQGLRDTGKIQPGQRVLVNGASGGVGTFAVQIAKALGAKVTGVCSTRNVDMVRSIGADHVIDYRQEDFTRAGKQYDLILDAAAYRPLSDFRRALNQGGTYVLVGGAGSRFIQISLMGPWMSRRGNQTFGTFIKKAKHEDLEYLRGLIEDGRVTPVIDRRYTLSEVPEALRYMEAGHARGKVVITV